MWNPAYLPRKTLYFHYHITYGHQTWQGGDLAGGVTTQGITQSFGRVVFRSHVKIKTVTSLLPQCLWRPKLPG